MMNLEGSLALKVAKIAFVFEGMLELCLCVMTIGALCAISSPLSSKLWSCKPVVSFAMCSVDIFNYQYDGTWVAE